MCGQRGISFDFYRRMRILKNQLHNISASGQIGLDCFAMLELPAETARCEYSAQFLLLHTENLTVEVSMDCNEDALCKALRAVRYVQ